MADVGCNTILLPPQYFLVAAQISGDKQVAIVSQRVIVHAANAPNTSHDGFGSFYGLVQPISDLLIGIGQGLIVERVVFCTMVFFPRGGKQGNLALQCPGHIAVNSSGGIAAQLVQVLNSQVQIIQDIIGDFCACITRSFHQFRIRIQRCVNPRYASIVYQQVVVIGRTEVIRLAQTLLESIRFLILAAVDVLQQEVDVADGLVVGHFCCITQCHATGQSRVERVGQQVVAACVAKSDAIGCTAGLGLNGAVGCVFSASAHRHTSLIEHVQVHLDLVRRGKCLRRRKFTLRLLVHVEASGKPQAKN